MKLYWSLKSTVLILTMCYQYADKPGYWTEISSTTPTSLSIVHMNERQQRDEPAHPIYRTLHDWTWKIKDYFDGGVLPPCRPTPAKDQEMKP